MIRRPADLAEVARLGRDGTDEGFEMAVDEFADAFYLTTLDAGRQAMLDPIPTATGSALRDAWIGAVGEHMATRWGLRVPAWVDRPIHFALDRAVYAPSQRSLRADLFVHSPTAFRRRLLFVPLEPLMRARFPRHLRRTTPLSPPESTSCLDDGDDPEGSDDPRPDGSSPVGPRPETTMDDALKARYSTAPAEGLKRFWLGWYSWSETCPIAPFPYWDTGSTSEFRLRPSLRERALAKGLPDTDDTDDTLDGVSEEDEDEFYHSEGVYVGMVDAADPEEAWATVRVLFPDARERDLLGKSFCSERPGYTLASLNATGTFRSRDDDPVR